jgi:hypothetical protein
MQTNLHLTYADGTTKNVLTNPADIVALESKFEISIARLGSDFKMSHIYFLAWHVEKRTKATELEFEAWLETLQGVETADPKASKA